MLRKFLLLIVVFLAPACNGNPMNFDLTEKEYLLQSEFLKKAIVNTPYSALIKVTSVDTFDVPDSDKLDDYAEQKLTYHANVIEPYRGKMDKNITYVMYIEKGEEVEYPKEALIVTLCQSKDGLFWPGVGASFSSDGRLRELAKKYSQQLNKQQTSFDDCE